MTTQTTGRAVRGRAQKSCRARELIKLERSIERVQRVSSHAPRRTRSVPRDVLINSPPPPPPLIRAALAVEGLRAKVLSALIMRRLQVVELATCYLRSGHGPAQVLRVAALLRWPLPTRSCSPLAGSERFQATKTNNLLLCAETCPGQLRALNCCRARHFRSSRAGRLQKLPCDCATCCCCCCCCF